MRLRGTNGPRRPKSLVYNATALFLGCGLAGFIVAPSSDVTTPPANQAQLAPVQPMRSSGAMPTAVSEQVQALLAKGGCPGWIVLASEPGALDKPEARPSQVYAGPLRTTSDRQSTTLPTVEYPVPVRPGAPTPPVQGPAARLAQLSNDDDLLGEEEDLLHNSPEVQQNQESPNFAEGAPEATAPSPTADDNGAPDDSLEQDSAPAARQYAPQDLLRDKPLSEQSAPADDLLDGADDLLIDEVQPPAIVPPPVLPSPKPELLEDQNDLLTPEALPPGQPAPDQPTPDAAPPATPPAGSGHAPADDLRCEFVADSLYPSATACRTCHEKIYDEWSMSSHAYAAVSPMFHRFEQTINDLTQGTIGYFCYRCHVPVGTALGLSRAAPLWDAPQVAREGVTCVACHRVREMYGKTNGERRIEPGDVFAPVYGSIGGDGVAAVAAQKDHFKVKTSPHDAGPGQEMHAAGFCFPQLSRSEFCTSCHQVAVYPGIKLEVVWEQYRASPACKKGISCQDCHMGRIPGVPSGYEVGPAAVVNKKNINPQRKHANHVFYGPGYSIAHPGVFPFNPKAERWSMRDWLLFDWRAGWGTDAFEDAVADGVIRVAFPEVWQESDDRADAREIIDDNFKKRDQKNYLRAQVMENGSHVDGPFFEGPQAVGTDLKFNYVVANANEGHNLPTASLGAQPQLWANVVLIGPQGNRVWESGYLDSNGDLADIHSEDVRHKRLEFDWQLFNLQTMFLITGAVGTDREFFLPVNIDIDPLPFIRPAAQPVSVINHPPFIRMEARSLAPLGSRRVPYRVPGRLLCEPGRYRLSFRMRNRTEPLYFMRFCGSTKEMQRAMLEGTLDFHQSSVEFEVR